MTSQSPRWLVTADERRASLFSCRLEPDHRWHIHLEDSLVNQHEHEHEHHRPSLLGRGPAANAAQHFAPFRHEDEELRRRFAREISAWLTASANEHGLKQADIFAATRILSDLRDELARGALAVRLHESELTRLGEVELATHPAVRAMLDAVQR